MTLNKHHGKTFAEIEEQIFKELGIIPRSMTQEEIGRAWEEMPKKIKTKMRKVTNKGLPEKK